MTLTTRYNGKRVTVVRIRRMGHFYWRVSNGNTIGTHHSTTIESGVSDTVIAALMTAFGYVGTLEAAT